MSIKPQVFAALAITAGLVLSSISEVLSQDVATGYRIQVGQTHPDFVYPTISDRSPVALSDFRGKKVLLLHFASW